MDHQPVTAVPERPDPPVLDARLRVVRDAFRLDVGLRIDAGEVVGLLGPNGAGKTTALRALAGLQPLTGGHITRTGACGFPPSTARSAWCSRTTCSFPT